MAKKAKVEEVVQVMSKIATKGVDGKLALPDDFCAKLKCAKRRLSNTEYDAIVHNHKNQLLFWVLPNENYGRIVKGKVWCGTINGQKYDNLYLTSQWGALGDGNGTLDRFVKIIRDYEKDANKQFLTDEVAQLLTTPDSASGTKDPNICNMYNLIVFGAPGTGKSRYLDDLLHPKEKPDGDDVDSDGKGSLFEEYERVTFYPTYSYAQFVGTYKPVMKGVEAAIKSDGLSDGELAERLKGAYDNAGGDSATTKTAAVLLFAEEYYESLSKVSIPQVIKKAGLPESSYTSWLSSGMALAKAKAHRRVGNEKSTIAYEFVPGPFLRVLVNALNDPQKEYGLVIEEINRANAAAVFGDVFQLLDRKDGVSEYAITASEDVKKFLAGDKGLTEAGKNTLRDLTGSADIKSLKIPANMYIWATMNSADQGVFPLDTAFKRRWEFRYMPLDGNDKCNKKARVEVGDYLIKWEDLRKAINELLKRCRVNEDKLLSYWFVRSDDSDIISAERFEMKVLMYLWEDAARMCRQNVFSDDVKVLSDLIKAWNGAKFDDVEEPDPEGKKPKRGVLRAGLNLGDTKFDFFEKEKPAEDKGREEDAEPHPPPPEKPAEAPAEAPAAQTPAAEAPAAEGKAGEEEKEAHPAEETDKGQKKGEEPQVKD